MQADIRFALAEDLQLILPLVCAFHVKVEARRLDIRALHLEVARDNQRARRLYASAGFAAREQYFLMSAPIGQAGEACES